MSEAHSGEMRITSFGVGENEREDSDENMEVDVVKTGSDCPVTRIAYMLETDL